MLPKEVAIHSYGFEWLIFHVNKLSFSDFVFNPTCSLFHFLLIHVFVKCCIKYVVCSFISLSLILSLLQHFSACQILLLMDADNLSVAPRTSSRWYDPIYQSWWTSRYKFESRALWLLVEMWDYNKCIVLALCAASYYWVEKHLINYRTKAPWSSGTWKNCASEIRSLGPLWPSSF